MRTEECNSTSPAPWGAEIESGEPLAELGGVGLDARIERGQLLANQARAARATHSLRPFKERVDSFGRADAVAVVHCGTQHCHILELCCRIGGRPRNAEPSREEEERDDPRREQQGVELHVNDCSI
jgi:hypothetical protein